MRKSESWRYAAPNAVTAANIAAGFGSICGASLATAATMGQVALPELKKAGYSGALSTACLAAGEAMLEYTAPRHGERLCGDNAFDDAGNQVANDAGGQAELEASRAMLEIVFRHAGPPHGTAVGFI